MSQPVVDITGDDRQQESFESMFVELQGGPHWTTWPVHKLEWYSLRFNDKLVEEGEALRSLVRLAEVGGGSPQVCY